MSDNLTAQLSSALKSIGVMGNAISFAIAAAFVASGVWLQIQYMKLLRKRDLQEKLEERQLSRGNNKEILVKGFDQLELSEREERILEMSAEYLLEQLRTKSVSCVEAVRSYQKKAYHVNESLNCVTHFIVTATEDAKELDNLKDCSHLPLYGLPFCVKLNIAMYLRFQSIGLAKDLFKHLATEDAAMVAALKKLGAVPFCQTNLPQAMFNIRCKNPIYGETLNPADVTRSPGGSSGGDGALVGQGGALLGLGTDVAGSVRIPAAFCGTCSFKPSAGRLSGLGIWKSLKGSHGIVSSPGFQCQDVGAIITTFKALTAPEHLHLLTDRDVNAIPVPFNNEMFNTDRKLCIGYNYGLDDLIQPTPAAKRAVDETVAVLRGRGHTVIRCNYPDQVKMQKLILGFVFAEGKKQHIALLKDDIVEDFLAWDLFIPTRSNLQKTLMRWFLKATGKHRMLPYWEQRELSAGELMMLMHERDQCIQDVRDSWVEKGLDAVISPPLPCPAMKLEHAGKASLVGQYTCLYNMLDFPAGTIQVTEVIQEDLDQMEGFPTDDLPLHNFMKLSAEGSVDLPVEVQVAALRWKDEMVLRVMKEIETAPLHQQT